MAELTCPQCKTLNRDTARYCVECGAALLADTGGKTGSGARTSATKPGMVLDGRYRVDEELGRGGFGAVFKAWDQRLSKTVAVKENLDTSPEAQRQFAREATALANLSHPNLPRVIDHFTVADQGQYLVMDFVEGQDLNGMIEAGGDLPLLQVARWVSQVADALEYLHSQQPPVLHRDIKPANIRISPRGQAMLVDFGLVKFSDASLKTTIGARAVTPGYAPPEQYGIGATDARTDLYALGATLFRALTRQDPVESVQRMAGEVQLPAHRISDAIPVGISQVIERAMQLDPAQRFAGAAEFRQALQAALASAQPGGANASPTTAGVTRSADRPSAPPAFPPTVVERRPVSGPPASGASASGSPGSGPPPARSVSKPVSRPLPAPRKAVFGVGIGLVVVICLLATLGGFGLYALDQRAAANATLTVQAQSTVIMQLQGTRTAQADMLVRETKQAVDAAATQTRSAAAAQSTTDAAQTATASAAVQSTSQSGTQAARSAEQTETAAQATGALAPTLAALNAYLPSSVAGRATLAAGPLDGELVHDPSNGFIETFEAAGSYTNFVAEVRFYNPYTTTRGDWDYGILFRDLGPNDHYRLVVSSDGTWSLRSKVSDGPTVIVEEGTVRNLNTRAGESNTLLLTCMGDEGHFYVNGQQVATVDLTARTTAGFLGVGTGFFDNAEVDGEATRYEDFTVWRLPSD